MGTDSRELAKFLRSFCQRTAQIIVQSRIGKKSRTACRIHAEGSDWFSLSTDDMPEVMAEAKKILAAQPLSFGISFCVEVSLRTAEGDVLVLEQWCLSINKPSGNQQTSRNREGDKAAIDQMGIMLKSLVVLTRLTLTYKLSRQQGPESHVICYKIYMGQPNTQSLGEGRQHMKIGDVLTSCGTVSLSLDYRTKLAISPQETTNAMLMKSDHFKPDGSPKVRKRIQDRKDSIGNDSCGSEEYHDPMPLLSASPPRICPRSPADSGSEKTTPSLPKRKIGAFADYIEPSDVTQSTFFIPEVPFASLLQLSKSPRKPSPAPSSPKSPQAIPSLLSTSPSRAIKSALLSRHRTEDDRSDGGSIKSNRSSASLHSAFDEFVMVELKSPFAEPDPENDLGSFFRQCQAAPPMSKEEPGLTLSELVTSLSHQVESLQLKEGEYNSLVEQLQQEVDEREG